ncbi:hypothetical protein BerOc1_01789 [Pseudodesulfovibrio hydrargyri]|uniref:Uncharacterized protein n=1 Tax=Pseudodesulfovibrio hydrargyri TaxID=2125990 RepID=A0A1J5MTC1_9BACT|nr:hypothetical protein [Pseudodesulfovibrio hydrargyri]OIQ49861.1 hypothetical protein BerOc1_01789 [Pseudodesulfovibrio hydrargyri]
MHYECDNCRWSGTWDALILETLCPLCRSSVSPRQEQDSPSSEAAPGALTGVTPGPPPHC